MYKGKEKEVEDGDSIQWMKGLDKKRKNSGEKKKQF